MPRGNTGSESPPAELDGGGQSLSAGHLGRRIAEEKANGAQCRGNRAYVNDGIVAFCEEGNDRAQEQEQTTNINHERKGTLMKSAKQTIIVLLGVGALLACSGCSQENQSYSNAGGGTTATSAPVVAADNATNAVSQNAPPARPTADTNALTVAATTNAPKESPDPNSSTGPTNGGVDTALVRAPGQAVAQLAPTEGNQVRGTVSFTATNQGVRVVADLTGLTPGDHGIHIHAKGDCSAPDAKSAGEHFNPTSLPHGGPDSAQHHVGDLGNITSDDSGNAHLDRVFTFLSLSGSNSIVDHSVIIHSGKDDFTSQPAGNSGNRVACGVISGR
jgi:superoxide dismutase, Cu-Zn family